MRILAGADAAGRPVRLRCIRWNSALSLYRRAGFIIVDETETHFLMERPCAALQR